MGERSGGEVKLFVPPGHYYSPIVDTAELRSRFPGSTPSSLPDIAIDDEAMTALWRELLPAIQSAPFPEQATPPFRYHFANPNFSYTDGMVLYAMLGKFKPGRIVEIGSGFSSACIVDTLDRTDRRGVSVTFIEPDTTLLKQVVGNDRLKQCFVHPIAVQKSDGRVFERLEANDVLFIDSTHVLKTGSDVCHELFGILPTLKPGVLVHFHDIFWPFEYGADWVLQDNRSWNEIYALRAFLSFNSAFEILFFNDYFTKKFRALCAEGRPDLLRNTGGSIWIRRRR